MWPRQKVLLVAASKAPGIDGVRSLLNGLHLEYSEVDPSTRELSPVSEKDWIENPLGYGCKEVSPFTEGIVCPEDDLERWSNQVIEYGIELQSMKSFLHKILEDEIVVRVPEETVFVEGCPLLGHILKEAGFEPSILWQTTDGTWKCERRLGLIWILPESWLAKFTEEHTMGRVTKPSPEARYELRETGIDFYRGDSRNFIGHLPRWPNSTEELLIVDAIAKSLNLGVSWLDIKSALRSIWTDSIITDNLRCNSHGFGWNARASGEKLPPEAVDHVEDWWAC